MWHDFRFAHHFHIFVFVLYVVGLLTSFIAPTPQTASAANGNWNQTTFAGTGDGTYTNTKPANSNASLGLTGNLTFSATYDADYNATYSKGTATASTSGAVSRPAGFNSSTGSVLVEEATTNIIPTANVATIDASTTGWSFDGASISRVTSIPTTPSSLPFQGSGALRVLNSVAGGDKFALTTTDANITAGQTYTFSSYVNIPVNLGGGGFWLRIIQFNGTTVMADNSLMSTQRFVTSGWERVSESFVAVAGATTAELRIENIGVGSVYVDALQLEQKPFPTSWYAVGASRTAGYIRYPGTNNFTAASGTVEMWVKVNNALKDTSANRYIFSITSNGLGANMVAIQHTTGGSWVASTSNATSNTSSVSVADNTFNGGTLSNGWHHFAVGWNSSSLDFYIDGQSVGAPVANPSIPSAVATYFYVGVWVAGTGNSNAEIDGVAVYNSAKSAAVIASDYALGTQLGNEVYNSSGSFVSNAISPASLYGEWGALTWNATTGGQTITVDVLNGSSGADILTDVASGTTLALSTTTYPSLKLRANLSTGSPTVTPLLNDWSVAYSYDNTGPSAPTGITLVPTSVSEILLSWNASVDTESSASPNETTIRYDVERAPDNNGNPGTWGEAGGTCSGSLAATTCTDGGLTSNTKYFYRVRATDVAGKNSVWPGEQEADTNTVGLWRLNEGTGTSVSSSGTATLTSSLSIGATGTQTTTTQAWASGANGRFNSSINLDGVDDKVIVNDNDALSFANGVMTAEAWFRVPPTAGSGYILSKGAAGSYEYGIQLNAAGTINFANWQLIGSNSAFCASSGADYRDNNWHHVVMVRDGNNTATNYLRGYVDGEPACSALVLANMGNGTSPFWLGGRSDLTTTLLQGQVDEVRISNTARSAGEIQAYYNEANTQPTSGYTLTNPPVLNTPATPSNDNKPPISNSGAPEASIANASVRLYDGVTQIAQTTAGGDGVFAFSDNDYSQPLSEGTHNDLTAKALNASSAESAASNTITIQIDTTPPSAPSTRTAAKVGDASGVDVADNAWNDHNNANTLYFAWSGASDPDPATFIKRYWVYFGPNSGAVPRTDGQATADSIVNTIKTLTNPISGTDYYLRIQTEDNAGNISSDGAIPTLFTYKFDNTEPELPAYGQATPAGWSTTNSYAFSWPAATDSNSQLKGYEYKRDNQSDDWIYTTNLSVSGIQSYQSGVNFFLVRPIDNAGNRSTDDNEEHVLRIPYYFSDPSAVVPQNLQVDLTQTQGGTVNRYKFTWDAVNDAEKYYYTINETPNSQSDYVQTNSTDFGSFATREGQNTFYLVAETAGGLANWSAPATITFSLDTEEPTAPNNLSITDASNRGTNQYALTIMWVEPQTNTPDFSHYVVERSDDGLIYAERATLDKTNTGYLDTGLTNGQEYFYRILSKDNVGNLSVASSVVSKAPTGKFTTAPSFTSEPEVEAKATSATVTWSNNRSSNTIVEYGLDEDYGQTQGSFNTYDTSHTYELTGLSPGTTYHFRAQSLDPGDLIGYSYNTAYSDDYTFTTTQAPGISDVTVSEIRLTSAIITWKTTSAASSKILYGTTSSYGSNYIDNSGSQTTTHTVKIDGLKDSTLYNFKIQGTDIEGNILNSDNYVFETLTFPKLSDLKVEQVKNASTSTVKINFSSNVPTTAQISLSGRNQKEASIYDLKTEHETVIAGLLDNSEYTISVRGRDQYGNETAVATESYKTAFDTRAPLITNITTESSITGYGAEAKGQVIISWETDEPSTSQVYYGIGTGGTEHSNQTQKENSLSTTHVVVISGLKPSAVYHFHPASADSSGNETSAEEVSLLTDQAASSVLDLIVNSLEVSLGWLFKVLGRREWLKSPLLV